MYRHAHTQLYIRRPKSWGVVFLHHPQCRLRTRRGPARVSGRARRLIEAQGQFQLRDVTLALHSEASVNGCACRIDPFVDARDATEVSGLNGLAVEHPGIESSGMSRMQQYTIL